MPARDELIGAVYENRAMASPGDGLAADIASRPQARGAGTTAPQGARHGSTDRSLTKHV
jgi:hypothetical protein